MTAVPLTARAPDPRLAAALLEEIRTTLAVFRATTTLGAEELIPLYAEQLPALTDVQELRLVFSVARQRATTFAPTPGEVREVLLELRRRRSRAPHEVAPLPPAPRFDDAARWLEAHPWAEAEVEREIAQLTRDWPPELSEERIRVRPVARLLVFNRLAHAASTLPATRGAEDRPSLTPADEVLTW